MDLFAINQVPCVSSCWGGGGRRHPKFATKVGNPVPATIPVDQQTTDTSHYPSRPVETFLEKAAMMRLEKTRCNKFLRTHLSLTVPRTQAALRSEEPLKSVASKSCQLVDRRENDRAFYRDA